MEFCSRTASIWELVGTAFLILKITIPLLIIILASVSLAKAAINGDDKAIKEGVVSVIKRLIAGVVIFLIPSLIRVGFFAISHFNEDMRNDAQNCINCLTNPKGNCDTSKSQNKIFK